MKRRLTSSNYTPDKMIPEKEIIHKQTVSDFDKAALENLGGSITFVRGGKLYEES